MVKFRFIFLNKSTCRKKDKGKGGGIRANKAKEVNSIKAYPGFCSMKCIRELQLNPGRSARDASPSQSYPQQ